MKTRTSALGAVLFLFMAGTSLAASSLSIFGSDAENRVYHFFIDESAGETNVITFEFWPNDGTPTVAEIFTTLNHRDQATLSPPDPNTVAQGDASGYWGAYTMADAGGGKWTLALPIQKCGSYDVRARYKVSGDANWRWYAGRNPVVNISDVATRDMVVYEMQANVVDATGNDYATRSTFASLTNSAKNWNLDYISALGVNTIWLQPFHPIGAKSDCNSGDPGSPYSIKNLFQVAEHLGSDGTRATAMREFTNFVIAADAKGVKVICDVIFNHVATDIEIERDPDNPTNLYANPLAEMRSVKYPWFSRYTGTRSGCPTTKPQSDWANYHYTETATSASEIGPAPADRNDFVWPDAFDLFWGTYPALGNINDTSDGAWTASADVKKMVEYYSYFIRYWHEKTGGKIGGFRCDFAQGLPRQAWQYLINRAKSLKPELYFVSESLDGGNIAYRAWKGGFDALNENELWAIVEDGDIQSTDLRNVIDQRKTQFGLALILRGTMNHDQGPWIGRKWDGVAMHSVFCSVDGTPQLYEGQELGYDALGQFSRERVEFGRTIPDIRNYHNMNNLWSGRYSGDNESLWHRYKDANLGRSRSLALRVADQYYLDRTGGQGPHPKIFSVLKYTRYGWDPKDQDVVVAFVNLQPGTANSGTFNVNVAPIYLDPTRTYNVKNLASTTPDTYLWASGRSGADIAANGIYVGFSADKGAEGSIAQFLKLEEQGGGPGPSTNLQWIGNTRHWPVNGSITAADDLWIDIESWPTNTATGGTVVYSTDGVGWNTRELSTNGVAGNNNAWHVNLGQFSAGARIQYAVQIVQSGGTNFWDNSGGTNYLAVVNSGGSGQPLGWIGAVSHWPTNGAITSADDLWVDIQSWPTSSAISGFVVYSADNGQTWPTMPLSLNATSPSNDFWHANLGRCSSGASIQYAVSLWDDSGTNQHWANAGGTNYWAFVGGTGSTRSVHWAGNTISRSLRAPCLAAVSLSGDGLKVESSSAIVGTEYRMYRSTNLVSWDLVTNVVAGGSTFSVTNPPSDGPSAFYRAVGQNVPYEVTVFEGDDLIVRAESWPQGRAAGANIVYSSNGQNWYGMSMTWIGTSLNNDLWEANLGFFPKGISVQFAIEIVDDQGFTLWDNNGSQNYSVAIRDPAQPDVAAPVLSYSPSNTTTAAAFLDVTLAAVDDYDAHPLITYTLDGSTPVWDSELYTAPLHITNDLTIKAIAIDASGNTSAVTSVSVKVNDVVELGAFKPYSVNPTLGRAATITIDGSPSDWTTNMLVALDVADDDPRTLGDNWTTHEAPLDFAYLWAAWDDTYLYLAWQYVDLTDIIDGANAGSAAGGKISSNDGILQWIAIDTIQGQGAAKDVWSKNGGQPYWTGTDRPDYQVYMAGSLWQGYISRAVNGVFALDDGGVNYKTAAAAGISYAKGSTLGAGTLWMPSAHHADGRFGALSIATHDTTRDSFYEIRIPLSFLQVTRAQLESNGIGVMMGAGSVSCMDSIPHDETTLDTPGVEVWNSSKEWTDTDRFTTRFARVGHQK
ncbi:MAG TPA: alpha-amylase family glycosyl hydrolase [Kiritimatiellia bacterium]|nr:alpha-amylase family glycosyl hydrolase [Kiritimatiellia bacterium]HRZ13504.1 alpha-amylase family glycosyl hydrolase [Kiritimatiellia bacterium]HSA19191.1 alpha-amylase family glycosyl hydrolase [Kiritimatiellia bacterium]